MRPKRSPRPDASELLGLLDDVEPYPHPAPPAPGATQRDMFNAWQAQEEMCHEVFLRRVTVAAPTGGRVASSGWLRWRA